MRDRLRGLFNIITKTDLNVRFEKIFAILLTILLSIAVIAPAAEAAGEKLVVFTDKSIYFDYPRYVADNTLWPDDDGVDIIPQVYAVVLDSNGMIIRSGLSFSASAKDIQKLNHTGSTSVHHSSIITTNGNYVNAGSLGSFSDSNGDGIYEAVWNYGSMPATIKDDHLIIRVTVNETTRSLSANYNITFTRLVCGHGNKAFIPDAGIHTTNSNHEGAPCTECHYGIEHSLNNSAHGPGTNLSNDPNLYDPLISSNTFNYMDGLEAGTEGALSTYGRADLCVACHDTYLGTGSGTLDMRTSSSRPSCGWGSGPDGVGCHAATNIKNSSLAGIDLFWKQNGAANSKSHNHSTTTTANASCEICHDNHGRWKLPQPNPGTYSNINEQCWICHGSSGPQSYAPHSSSTSNCESCHNDASGKLNAHLVPTGKSGGFNCTSCHNLNGQAGHDVDVTNMGSGAHANLNNLSQAANAANKKCWACHGTLNANGYANETDQPSGEHNQTMYKNPRGCPDCHSNTDPYSNFSAPQVVEHRIGAPDVPANGTQCYLCHNNSLTAISEADGFGITNPQSASASHYLRDANTFLMTTTIHSNDCTWCHFTNTNNASWGTPTDPRLNFSGFHTGRVNNDCYNCHGSLSSSVKLHDPAITAGGAGGQDCVSCHDGISGSRVNVASMNQTDSIHRTLNSGGQASGSADNRMCYACHTNDSYITGGVVNNGSIPLNSHPAGYNTPKNCTLCHTNTDSSTNFGARQAMEHRSLGNELQTLYYLNLNDSCTACHNSNEMLRSFSDDSGTTYSNVSHYGKSRNNTALVANNVVNCRYCHYNSSSAFEFEYPANKTISDHSLNYPATTPECTLCHNQGRMHDSTLTIPALNDALCTGCHTSKQEHNSTVLCISCHVNASASRNKAHPIEYLSSSGVYATANLSAVICENCHQNSGMSGFQAAPKIKYPMNHSSDPLAGRKWNQAGYWGEGEGSSNDTAVSQEVNITGTTSGISGAQTEDGVFESMTEANAGGSPVDAYTNVTGNTQTTGTVGSFSNMQSWSDGGAFAVLAEGGIGGGGSGTLVRYSSAGSATNAYNAPDNIYSSTSNGILNAYNSTAPSGGTITKVEAIFEVYTQMGGDTGEVWTLDWGLGNTGAALPPASWTNLKAASHDQISEQRFVYNITSSISSWTDIYNIWLQATMDKGVNGGSSTIYIDAMWVNVSTSGGTTTYSMNITTDTASVPAASDQYLEIRYNVTPHDNYSVQVFDGSTWNQKGTLSSLTMTVFNTSLSPGEYNSGNPRVRYTDVNPAGTTQGSLFIDYQRIHSVTAGGINYRLDIRQNVTGIPVENYYYLTIKGKTDGDESYYVQVYDPGAGWVTKSTINGAASAWYNSTALSLNEISSGKVQIRYVDTAASSDAAQNMLSIDYAGVRSVTSARGISSCEYCHGDTRHNAAGLGKPASFQGANRVGETDLAQSTWCLGCHVNGSANYNNMKAVMYPIPPEITSGDPNFPGGDAVSHAAYTSDNDCAACHGVDTSNITTFIHDVAVGTSCTGCHSQPPSGSVRYNMTGAHDLHKARGYGDVPETGCNYCHSTGGKNEGGHPGTYDNATVFTNASASIDAYTMNPASGNDDTCSGVSCHSNGLSGTAKVGTAIWDSTAAGACNVCHSNAASGLPPTGNHTRHYTDKGYACSECHGLNADAGNQSGHKTNALIDINFTNVTGSINASRTCTVYCHSPNPNDPKSKPTWNISSVGCGDCHSIPPATTRYGAAHTTETNCDSCHGAGAVNGTQTGHINGAIDTSGMTCASCHAAYSSAVSLSAHNQTENPTAPACTDCHIGYQAVYGHTTGGKGYIVNETNTCRNCHIDNVSGFYERHSSSSDCTTCHFANTTRPFEYNASLFKHDHNLTVEHNFYEYNQTGIPVRTNNGTGTGMFPYYTCTLTCHKYNATTGVEGKIDEAAKSWILSNHAQSLRYPAASDNKNNCAKCKSPVNYNDSLKVLNPNITAEDWQGIQCRVCHNLHDRKFPYNTGPSGFPLAFYNATATSNLTTNPNGSAVYDKLDNATQLCEKCHSGTTHDSKFAGTHKDTANFTCVSCHMNSSFNTELHKFEVKNTASNVTGCNVCHSSANHTFQFTSQHTGKVECVACHDQTVSKNATGFAVSSDNNYGIYKDNTTNEWTTYKVSHGTAATWPLHNLTRTVTCDKCHGTTSVYSGLIAPLSGAFCEGCHSQPPSGSVRYNMTGAHDLHKSKGYGDVPETGCNYCHSTGGANEGGHPGTYDNATVFTNASASIDAYTMNPASGNDDTCSGVSCHSNGLSGAAKVGTAIWDSTAAGACSVCHSNAASGLPPTGNHTRHYTDKGYACSECHGLNADAGNQSGHKTNALIDINFTNVIGSINASRTCTVYCHSPNPNDPKSKPTWNISSVGCGDCHSIPPPTTRNGAAHTANTNCDSCHGAGAVNGTQAGHINGAIDTSGIGCISCHDAVTSLDLGLHSGLNGTTDVENGDCTTCHFGSFQMVKGAANNTNTYFCYDCHNQTSGGQAPAQFRSSIKFMDKLHGEAACMDCHAADGTYHQDNPRGSVANSTYVNRYPTTNINTTDCADCHRGANLDDAPFYAPGGGSHIDESCTSGGCHGPSGTVVQVVHRVNPLDSKKPDISIPTLDQSTVTSGTDVNVSASVNFTLSPAYIYALVDGAQYRIMEGASEVRPWTPMTASDGNFNSILETATARIDTNGLAGTYSIEVRGMGGGPSQNPAVRYSPMNGDISAAQAVTLTVQTPQGYINGTVKNTGGTALSGVTVTTAGAGDVTGADGSYSLMLPEGVYNVTASRQPVYIDNTISGIAVTPGNTTAGNITLVEKAKGTISGTVSSV